MTQSDAASPAPDIFPEPTDASHIVPLAEGDACSGYADTRDVGYPPGTRYLDKMAELPDGLREAVLAAYSVLHLADDLVDDPSRSAPERRADLAAFQGHLLDAFAGRDVASTHLGWACQALHAAASRFPQLRTEPFSQVFAALDEMLDWPAMPHFQDLGQWEHYNRRLFRAIVMSLSPILLAPACRDADTLARCEGWFEELMLAMQVVNLLMDLEEDAATGQFLIPISHVAATAPWAPPPWAVRELLARGRSHVARAAGLTDPSVVGAGSATFFAGLADIFGVLAAHLEARHGLVPGTAERTAVEGD